MRQNLGQHFLTDAHALARIVGALEITPQDTVIEIGPGHGELTRELVARHPQQIIAIEKDPRLAAALRERYGDAVVHEGDVRRVLAEIVAQDIVAEAPYKIVGNIPYYLTGFLLRQLAELPRPPNLIVLTVQKQVAERLAAGPPHMNKLAASVQFWADASVLFTIPSQAFRPAPEVASAVVRLEPRPLPMDAARYYAFVHRLFQQPRKNIANNVIMKTASPKERVAQQELLSKHGISAQERAQNLDIPRIVALAKDLGA